MTNPDTDVVTFRRAIITGLTPLRVKLDGEAAALLVTPDSLVDPAGLAVNDWVRVEMFKRKVVIHGKMGGSAPSWASILGKPLTFTPSAHVHSGADITTGTVPDARLSYGVKTQTQIPTNYAVWNYATPAINFPVGVSTVLMEYSAASPSLAGVYASVTTIRAYSTADSTIQWWSAYQAGDDSVYYRQWFYSTGVWSAWKKVAVAGNGGVPFAQAAGVGSFGAIASTGSADIVVTFPSGRFSVAPIVNITSRNSWVQPEVYAVSASSLTCRMRNFYTATSGASSFHWTATQMTAGSASG